MKPIVITLLLLLVIYPTFGQNFWAKKQAGGNVDETLDIDVDQSNNTYATGYFSSIAEISGINLSVQGLTDIFVSKVLPNGSTDWSKSFGGAQSDRGLGVTHDGEGNVIVCGFYTGNVNFGNGVSLTSNGGQDAFVLKLDGNGNALWARTGGSSGSSDRANAVAVDGAGNVIITGQFSGSASFDSFTLDASDGSNDAFIVKYDPNGNEQWAKQGTGESLDRGLGLATTFSNDAIYAIGQFSGNISFDNTYNNTVQNAFYMIKYSSDGNEEWFRWGGGSEESIAYAITSSGDNAIYITGDYGATLNLFGTGTSVSLSSGFDNSIFILSLSETGDFIWGESAGSNSRISSRGIDVHSGELAISGWFECTFDEYSEEYGEATFNSLGFRDAFMAKYSSTGAFDWARNFGANSDEQCNSIALLNNGDAILAGSSAESDLIVPVTADPVLGMTDLITNQNEGLNYCSDPNYGNYRMIEGSGGLDGFVLRAIVPERSPMDFYQRSGSGCDLSIPDACIYENNTSPSPCPESVLGCPPINIVATNFTLDEIGFGTEYNWPVSGSNNILASVSSAGTENVIITSQDGCYTTTDDIEVDIIPPADTPLITDSQGINNSASSPSPIFICPGESVDVFAEFPEGYTFQWTGAQLGTEPVFTQPISLSETGLYTVTVTNPEGCSRQNFVSVFLYDLAEDVPPFISFLSESDTIQVCQGSEFSVELLNELTLEAYPTSEYDVEWFLNAESIPGEGDEVLISADTEGWYVVSVELTSQENQCTDQILTQFDLDSVYVEIVPAPDVSIELTGPEFYCPGDTLVFFLEYAGELSINFDPIENFGDSLYVTGPGFYDISASATNEFGCTSMASDFIIVEPVQTPEISTNPTEAIVCPGDSVQVFTSGPGTVTWQGPSGTIDDTSSIFVQEPGFYFAEVEFYEGCALVSNTIEVFEFSTPFLDVSNEVLCPGGEVEIGVIGSLLDQIEWQAPFTGNDSVQTVTEPGLYSVLVSGCNVETELSILVEATEYSVEIEVIDPEPTCDGDSILIAATPGLEAYEWSPVGDEEEVWFTEGSTIQVVGTDEYGCELISNQIDISFEDVPPLPVFDFTPVCEGEPFTLEVPSDLEVNFLVEPGGATLTNENMISISEFVNDTTFYVFLNNEFCDGPIDSITIGPKPFPDPPIPTTDAPVCTGTNLSLEVLNAEAGVNYIWLTPTGNILEGDIVSYSISNLDQEGEYLAYANLEDCLSDTVGIDVSLFQTRQVTLPPDTALCFIPNFTIAPDTLYQSYQWFDGSNDSVFIPDFDAALSISLTTTDFNGCRSSDLMLIDFADCIVQIPNIITPNGDGLNDQWVIGLDRPQFFDVVIYNRWGRVVYESKDFSTFWDGTHYQSGELCSEGIYFYIIRVNDFEGRAFEQQGDLTVIRD